jgi:hypothetical protein
MATLGVLEIMARTRSKRAILREELSERFIPYLRSRGFEQGGDASGADARSTSPFGMFERNHGTVTDIISIQFDKYRRAKFIVNFRKDPPEIVKFRSAKDNLGFVQLGRLHSRPRSARWFTMRTFLGFRSPEKCAKAIVDRLMILFPEVESWFKDGTMGDHIRLIPIPMLRAARDQAEGET